ncbi:uncharacterized protein BDZ99DRAFT_413139 [Mytilinidion resinicola]|uniref:Uncharacterized protein n=1 Tax=Mytilinidion resinicola TaxID=574789 RepID=A0A6A6YWR7_9PEZI|nr:uncharacterized protein BDZ99DRAFT_413139 [Mytilinidion resinicola]KAF2812425.1 hypothetical protein BDZ99DRAFT_413139 [Mytilinidion resinicola]
MPLPKNSYLARSARKEEFLARLGLNDVEHSHKLLYRHLLDEASAGRDRLSQDPNNLYAQNMRDPNIRPPYSADNMTETAMHREVLNIWKLASEETRPYYDYGSIQNQATRDNWVIRWTLWHVFRYRDNRNCRRPTELTEPNAGHGKHTAQVTYWDPVKNLN